jgi:hypothetical protein
MSDLRYRIASLMRRVAELEKAPSAEGAFYDNPTKRSVRNLAESKAISNRPSTTEKAIESGCVVKEKKLMESETAVAPPPPEEILKKPGGKELSTLNQFIVKTEEPIKGVPKSYDQTPRAEAPLKNPSTTEIKQDLVKKVVERHIDQKEKVKAVKKVLLDRME